MANLFKMLYTKFLSESAKFCTRYDKNILAYFFLGHGVDGLLCMLCDSGVGCFSRNVFNVFVGTLAYADDIAFLSSTP